MQRKYTMRSKEKDDWFLKENTSYKAHTYNVTIFVSFEADKKTPFDDDDGTLVVS